MKPETDEIAELRLSLKVLTDRVQALSSRMDTGNGWAEVVDDIKAVHLTYRQAFNSTLNDLIEQGAYDVAQVYIDFLQKRSQVKKETVKKPKQAKPEPDKKGAIKIPNAAGIP